MSKKTIEERIEAGREYRRMAEIRVDAQEGEEQKYVVEGYATTFNEPYVLWEDRDGWQMIESIDAKAFENTDMSDVIMQYDHQGKVYARNKNGTLQLEVDDHGLKIRADLSGTEAGRQLYEEIKGGYTDKMSFGFTVDGDVYTDDGESVHRTITSIRKLYDVSAVSIPANDATEISARSKSEGVIAEAKAERLEAEERAAEKERLQLRLRAMRINGGF